MDIPLLISTVGICLSIATFFIGRQVAAKESGKIDGNLQTDLAYIKSGIQDIQDELKSQRNTNTDFAIRLDRVEILIKDDHKRIEAIEKLTGSKFNKGDEIDGN